MRGNKFNQVQYINDWKKTHKKQFKVELDIEEYELLCDYLKVMNMTKVDFVRYAIKKFIKK